MTGDEYLESIRDGREIWIYGERVKDVTTHPAFRNTARMLARLYDALHDPARKDVLTTPTDTGSGGFTHRSTRRRATPRSWSARATPSPSGRASATAGSAAAPTTRRRSSPRSAPTADYYAPFRRQRAPLVQEGPGRGLVRQPRHRQPAGGSRQAARRGQRRLHARREGDRRRPDRERRQGRGDDVDADALQLHRQQRRAADQDEGVRVRLHRADRRARREAVLPAVVRADGGDRGHAVRLPAVEPDGRERFDPRLRQGVRALGKRVRLRRHREGEQLLSAVGLPAALHVPGLHAARRQARLPRRPAAQGRRGDRREGLPRRAGARRRGARVAQPASGA